MSDQPTPAPSFCAQCLFWEGLEVALISGKCPRCVIEGDRRRLRQDRTPLVSPPPPAERTPAAGEPGDLAQIERAAFEAGYAAASGGDSFGWSVEYQEWKAKR